MDLSGPELHGRIKAVLATDIAPDARVLGERLLGRLVTPVRVGIAGRAGSGKSTLHRMLTRCPELTTICFTKTIILPDPTSGPAQTETDLRDFDMVLWCGQGFDVTDRAQWSMVPNALKDHSFLVVTKADSLAASGLLQPTLAALQHIAAEEFHSQHPIATVQAFAAQEQNDATAFRASGGAALRTAILRDAAAGRRAVEDGAELFLHRHEIRRAVVSAKLSVASLTTQTDDAFWADAHSYAERMAQNMAGLIDPATADQPAAILDRCCEIADGLANLLATSVTASPTSLHDDIMTAADTILLMQVEGGAAAAVDALDLLLQLRREIADSI